MEERMNYPLWLHSLNGIGERKIDKLLERFKCAQGVYYAYEADLRQVQGLTRGDIDTILYRRNTANNLQMQEELCRKKVDFISIEDKNYPLSLRDLSDAPYGIYLRGRLPDAQEKVVAMVGARLCSPYGKTMAKELAGRLGELGVSVVSGMARGIDGYSQDACINHGGTSYGILAGGVDMIYPPEHRYLYDKILERGGIISEYPPGTEPKKGMFPRRNRIISGLSQMVILVEAKLRSGSLITADCALEQGKDVFAFPGRVGDVVSAGCNNYIKQGAGIIDSIESFLEERKFIQDKNVLINKREKIFLEKEESMVYSCLRLTPSSLNEIMNETGLGLMQVISCISRLEELGLAEEYYKNHYIRSA